MLALIVVTVLALVYTVVRGDKARLGHLGASSRSRWALVLAERWVGQGPRRRWSSPAPRTSASSSAPATAGIAKKSLVLLPIR